MVADPIDENEIWHFSANCGGIVPSAESCGALLASAPQSVRKSAEYDALAFVELCRNRGLSEDQIFRRLMEWWEIRNARDAA